MKLENFTVEYAQMDQSDSSKFDKSDVLICYGMDRCV